MLAPGRRSRGDGRAHRALRGPRGPGVAWQVNGLRFETLFCRAAADGRLTRSRETIASSGAWLVLAGTSGIRRPGRGNRVVAVVDPVPGTVSCRRRCQALGEAAIGEPGHPGPGWTSRVRVSGSPGPASR